VEGLPAGGKIRYVGCHIEQLVPRF